MCMVGGDCDWQHRGRDGAGEVGGEDELIHVGVNSEVARGWSRWLFLDGNSRVILVHGLGQRGIGHDEDVDKGGRTAGWWVGSCNRQLSPNWEEG